MRGWLVRALILRTSLPCFEVLGSALIPTGRDQLSACLELGSVPGSTTLVLNFRFSWEKQSGWWCHTPIPQKWSASIGHSCWGHWWKPCSAKCRFPLPQCWEAHVGLDGPWGLYLWSSFWSLCGEEKRNDSSITLHHLRPRQNTLSQQQTFQKRGMNHWDGSGSKSQGYLLPSTLTWLNPGTHIGGENWLLRIVLTSTYMSVWACLCVYIHKCVSMPVCVYTRVCERAYVCIYMSVWVCLCVYTSVWVYLCVHTWVCERACMYIHECVSMPVYIHECVSVPVCVYTQVCEHACGCIYTQRQYFKYLFFSLCCSKQDPVLGCGWDY